MQTHYLGLVAYPEALRLQDAAGIAVKNGGPDRLLGLEHPVVITSGVRAADEDFILPLPAEIDFVRTERGGRLTAHEPGQLVIYPIFNTRAWGPRRLVETLESTTVRVLNERGLSQVRVIPGRPGIYTGHKKIASIGLRFKNGVSSHGIAINVNNDLKTFSYIQPCGISQHMTSLQEETGKSFDLEGLFCDFSKYLAQCCPTFRDLSDRTR